MLAAVRDAVSELLASFRLFFHCHCVTSGFTKARPTLLELGLQELCGCWKVIGAEVLKTLSSQLEP